MEVFIRGGIIDDTKDVLEIQREVVSENEFMISVLDELDVTTTE